MAIEVIYNEKKVKTKPHYLLVYDYMIGDADGEHSEELELSLDNPHIERYVTLLNNLKPNKGFWGISLEDDRLELSFKEGQFSQEDYDFLKTTTSYPEEEPEDDFLTEFRDGVRTEHELSYLSFEGVTLFYINETGKKFSTKFV